VTWLAARQALVQAKISRAPKYFVSILQRDDRRKSDFTVTFDFLLRTVFAGAA
jgi:hypothetical protein